MPQFAFRGLPIRFRPSADENSMSACEFKFPSRDFVRHKDITSIVLKADCEYFHSFHFLVNANSATAATPAQTYQGSVDRSKPPIKLLITVAAGAEGGAELDATTVEGVGLEGGAELDITTGAPGVGLEGGAELDITTGAPGVGLEGGAELDITTGAPGSPVST